MKNNRQSGYLMITRIPHERKRFCGARTRNGESCKRRPNHKGRCHLHGGKSLGGIAHPNFKHGRYSKYVPRMVWPSRQCKVIKPNGDRCLQYALTDDILSCCVAHQHIPLSTDEPGQGKPVYPAPFYASVESMNDVRDRYRGSLKNPFEHTHDIQP